MIRSGSSPDVRGQRVLITGGARGIGAATAALFAARGARVWIGDVDDDVCRETAQELGVIPARLDVTSTDSWQHVIDGITSDGPLRVLVTTRA